jgi:hypothetical protein
LTAESKEELQKLDEELLQRVSHVQFFIAWFHTYNFLELISRSIKKCLLRFN